MVCAEAVEAAAARARDVESFILGVMIETVTAFYPPHREASGPYI